VNVSFTPILSGARSGALTIVGGQPITSFTVTLAGSGILNGVLTLSTQTLSFSPVEIGTISAAQMLTITNSGGLPLNGLSLSLPAAPFVETATTCGQTLNAGASCTLSVEFQPTAAGASSNTLTIAVTSPATSATVAMAGTGIDFTLAPNGSNSTAILTGQTANYMLNLTPLGGMTGSFTLTCTGAPADALCTLSPSPAILNGSSSTSIGVAVATGLTASAPRHRGTLACVLIGSISILLLLVHRKAPALRSLRLLSLLLLLMVCGNGCGLSVKSGSGRSGTDPAGSSVTPLGTYTLTVTASSAGITHSTTLQLVVN
jgi:hypothetical protein